MPYYRSTPVNPVFHTLRGVKGFALPDGSDSIWETTSAFMPPLPVGVVEITPAEYFRLMPLLQRRAEAITAQASTTGIDVAWLLTMLEKPDPQWTIADLARAVKLLIPRVVED